MRRGGTFPWGGRRRLLLGTPVLLAAPALASTVPLRIIVGFPPGGTADILARLLAEGLADLTGEPAVVENRPGAGTAIATEAAARAAPDGRTLLVAGTSQMINEALKREALPALLRRDLAPVGLFAVMPGLVVAGPATPGRTLPEVLDAARRARDPLAYGSSGTGTSSHLAGVLLAQLAGVELLHVPQRGAAAAFNDLLAGRLALMFPNVPEALGHLRGGRLRALAVASGTRSPVLPDVPTAAEGGLPGYDVPVWLGLAAPVQTPPAELRRLSGAVADALRLPRLAARWGELGAEPGPAGAAAMAARIAGEAPRWAGLVAASGMTID